jgi:two-component system nitrate/nitrite response regulator NarL
MKDDTGGRCIVMNILIVADQPLIRRGIIDILFFNKESYTIFEAGNSDEAMLILRAQLIEIAFIDLQLGEDDGLELIKRAKDLDKKRTKFILLATMISIFEFRRAKELGVAGYILKDALIEDILYAFNVIRRGEKYYPARIVEKAFYGMEGGGLKLLTERELDVFSELSKGLTNFQIGNNLYITEGTIKKHISSILNKLKLSNRTEAVVFANKISSRQNF